MKKLVPIKMSLNTQETRHQRPTERIYTHDIHIVSYVQYSKSTKRVLFLRKCHHDRVS